MMGPGLNLWLPAWRRSGAPALPATLPELWGWWDSRASDWTVVEGFVLAWADRRGIGRNWASLNGDTGPVLADWGDGRQAISFDGTTLSVLQLAALAAALHGSDKPFSVFAAVKLADLASNYKLFGIGNLGGDECSVLYRASTNNYHWIRRNGSGSVLLGGGTPTTQRHRWIYSFTGTAVSVYIDGVAVVSNQPSDITVLTATTAFLGAAPYFGVDSPFKGLLAEVGLYTDAKSAGDCALLDAYLAEKWGI